MSADIVKQGYVKFQSKSLGKNLGVWNRKWLMLRRQSGKGPVRLEKYKDEATASVQSVYGADKKIIDLTRVDRIERLPESIKKHGINILVDAFISIQFCVGSEMEAESWSSAIRDEIHPENRQTQESFSVYMLPNDYMSTSGDCTLQLTRDSLRVLERYGGREIVSWPLSGIRRFGVERNMFTIEAGSSCPTGSGTFYFGGDDSEFIFQRIQSLSQASSRTDASEGNLQSSFSMSNWGNALSINELSNRRGEGGQTEEENEYTIDTTMPTPRPSERLNNSVQRSTGSSNRGRGAGGQQGEYAYSELPVDLQRNASSVAMTTHRPSERLNNNSLQRPSGSSNRGRGLGGQQGEYAYSELPVDLQRNASSVGQYSVYRRQDDHQPPKGVRPPLPRSNTVDASTTSSSTASSTSSASSSSMQVRGVNGPYYAVSRPNNHAANQEQRTKQTNLQSSSNGSRRLAMERSRTVDTSSSSADPSTSTPSTASGPPRDQSANTIRTVRVEGDYYAVARGKNNSNRPTNQAEPSDRIQSDQTNAQTRAGGAGRTSANSTVGQGARPSGGESPYYAATELYAPNDQDDDDDDDGVYSVTEIDRALRSIRR